MEENRGKWIAIVVLGLAIIFVGLYTALKPSYHERLETNSTRLLNDTILRVRYGSFRIGNISPECYINYNSPITYNVPGELQDVNISGVVEEKNKANDIFLFRIIDGIEFKQEETGYTSPDYISYYEHSVIGTTHFNFSIGDFTVLKVGIYFMVVPSRMSKIIEIELKNVTLTWTYKIFYGKYYPGASMGILLIILGSILEIVGIRKRKEQNQAGSCSATQRSS